MNLELINRTIKTKGIKKKWLADQMNVHPNTLGYFLKGKTMLGADAFVKLLAILNLDAKSLVKDAA